MLRRRASLWLLLCISISLTILGHTKLADSKGNTPSLDYVEELLVDRRPPPSDTEQREFIAQELPSLPWEFHVRDWHNERRLNESCAPYPHILQLQFHNNYWQVHRSDNLTFYLYGAYYDNRTYVQSWEGEVLVRILTMVNMIGIQFADYPPSYCQLWYEEQNMPIIVPVREYRVTWYSDWGNGPDYYYPTFVECAMPQEVRHLVPQTVSLVASECARATNNLRVIYEPPAVNHTQRGFAVCSTGLYNPDRDNSVRLVEWLELLRLLGAEHVMLPNFGIHPNATSVLRYYESEGFVSAPSISLVRGEPALSHFTYAAIKMCLTNHRLNEIIPLNDCLYRNMYKYEYIVVLDVDEVIMPVGEQRSWADLVHYAKEHIRYDDCEGLTSLCFRNVYFPAYPERKLFSAEVPYYMYMMQHVARVAEHLEPMMATKCFHNATTVTGLHNHYALHWTGGCGMQTVNETAGQMQHYREPDIPETLENPVIDDVIWRYKQPLVERTQMVLRQLGLLRQVKAKAVDIYKEAGMPEATKGEFKEHAKEEGVEKAVSMRGSVEESVAEEKAEETQGNKLKVTGIGMDAKTETETEAEIGIGMVGEKAEVEYMTKLGGKSEL